MRTLFLLTILAGALTDSALAQAPDAGCAWPSEPKGIPAAIDAAITGPADKDRACMKALVIPEARMMFVSLGADGAPTYALQTLDDWIARVKARGHVMLEEKQLKFHIERLPPHKLRISQIQGEQEMSMRTIRTRTITCAVAMAAVLSLAPLRAQTTQTALSKEAGTLSDKFAGLARVMAGKYNWKPGEGVRSVGDVFNLIVTENGLLVGTLTGAGGGRGGGRGAQAIEPEKLQEALKTSYANLQKAIEGLSDADLKAPVKLFGRDMTKEDAVRFLFGDQHEHLGQSIAYARSNGVVPPWSK